MATRVFGVGVDVAHVPRLARCAERFGARFLRRALHPSEIEEFHARCAADRPAFLASRWAAKEAVFKAFHGFRLQFPEVRVARSSTSTAAPPALPIEAPLRVLRLEFSGATAVRAKQLRLLEPHISLSHDGDYAIAYVVLEQLVDDEANGTANNES